MTKTLTQSLIGSQMSLVKHVMAFCQQNLPSGLDKWTAAELNNIYVNYYIVC
jgi:hypothetical protein